ncbi:MAG: transposase [Candidatus Moranbacteria bacterium]|nr:transposase [Candidatus Moranbacteria bacterium]
MRKTLLKNEEYYHIYNRGVDKRNVFEGVSDYLRFIKSLEEFNRLDPIGSIYEQSFRKKDSLGNSVSKLVKIVAYCLNPNHYHLILKQIKDNGIEKFMHKVGLGYSKYFNHRHKRSGVLFQGKFQAINIDSNEYLLYLSAYVNKNKFIHGYDNEFNFSSLNEYIGKSKVSLCSKNVILKQFRNKEEYNEYLKVNAKHLKEKKELKKYLLE